MIDQSKPAELSAQEITSFEGKNPSREKVEVFEYESKRGEKPARFFVAKPNRQQIEIIEETREKSRSRSNDLMINTGVLAGDVDQLDEDDALYFGLLRDVTSMIEAKKKL
ncbi:MAG: hypothetical protein M3Y54_02595 [Bacteroidota bacterium]|nr:hypothetical protein [Bacteroidota bacterium]